MDEAQAVDRARAGDVDAYEWLVRQHSAAAVRLAFAICGSTADAEDAAQEAFLKMFNALDTFRRDGALRPWLLRILANEARNHNRSAPRRTALVGRMASMVYLAKAGRLAVPGEAVAALLSEFRGHLDARDFQTMPGNGTDAQAVQVGGARGFWLPSGSRQFSYVRPDGRVGIETIRLATNTLVWSAGGIT